MTEMRKTALVTGAATGIGRAIAVALAESGFDVAINYSRSEKAAAETQAMVEAAGSVRTGTFRADVSDESDVVRLIGNLATEAAEAAEQLSGPFEPDPFIQPPLASQQVPSFSDGGADALYESLVARDFCGL